MEPRLKSKAKTNEKIIRMAGRPSATPHSHYGLVGLCPGFHSCAPFKSRTFNAIEPAFKGHSHVDAITALYAAHQKGEKREHCSMGHHLALPILRKFTEILPVVDDYQDIKIKCAYTTGLAANKDELYAKDSIDFVLS